MFRKCRYCRRCGLLVSRTSWRPRGWGSAGKSFRKLQTKYEHCSLLAVVTDRFHIRFFYRLFLFFFHSFLSTLAPSKIGPDYLRLECAFIEKILFIHRLQFEYVNIIMRRYLIGEEYSLSFWFLIRKGYWHIDVVYLYRWCKSWYRKIQYLPCYYYYF